MRRKIQIGLALLTLVLFGACLFAPALKVTTWPATSGLLYFATGWLGPVAGHFEWYANPIMVLAVKNSLQERFLRASVYSVLALLLVLQTVFRGCIVRDEGGYCQAISEYMLGYWLWLACASVLIVWAVAGYVFSQKNP